MGYHWWDDGQAIFFSIFFKVYKLATKNVYQLSYQFRASTWKFMARVRVDLSQAWHHLLAMPSESAATVPTIWHQPSMTVTSSPQSYRLEVNTIVWQSTGQQANFV